MPAPPLSELMPDEFRRFPEVDGAEPDRSPEPVEHRRRGPRLLHAAERFAGERFVILGERAVAGLTQSFPA